MTGIEAFLEVLAAAGVRYVFGNPGTTELPLNAALATDRRFRYVLGVHEIPVIAMADGFAMASGGVAVANVHAAPGLGNAMGMLYNAFREGTPLVLTAGQQDTRLRFGEPVLEADLVAVARPWTKWAAEVQRATDIPAAVRRAVQTAMTPPTGPVFLSLPLDFQTAQLPADADLSAPHVPDARFRPPAEAVRRAAAVLAAAERPVILAGSRVTESGAVPELVALSDRLGAPVFAENATAHGRVPMPVGHPFYAGPLPLWSPDIRDRLAGFDVALAVGLDVIRLYIHAEPSRPLPAGLRLVQLDNDPRQLGKNFPPEVGLLGDPKAGLAELSEAVAALQAPAKLAAAARRRDEWAARKAAEGGQLAAKLRGQRDERPMTPMTMMAALARVLPPDVAVVEEAPTTHHNLFERLGALQDPAGHFAHRGWALGWGLGCSLGVKLAWPERPVLSLVGDGSALYGIQALWSAARHHIPVTVVIANNAEYRILRVCGEVLGLPALASKDAPGLDLAGPAVDFVGLARSFGVEGHRVHDPDELSDRVRGSLAGDRPVLFDVPIGR